MKKIGLTGGLGCGKSETGRIFNTFPGWKSFDADRICHEIYEEPGSPFTNMLRERWGKEILQEDGTPDRTGIAARIFGNEPERQWLNSILHPEIRRRMAEQMQNSGVEFCLMEVSLLFESGWQSDCDAVIAVWSSPEIQMQRLLTRNWSRDHAEQRIRSQWSADRKLEAADYGIINDSGKNILMEQCSKIAASIENRFKEKTK